MMSSIENMLIHLSENITVHFLSENIMVNLPQEKLLEKCHCKPVDAQILR